MPWQCLGNAFQGFRQRVLLEEFPGGYAVAAVPTEATGPQVPWLGGRAWPLRVEGSSWSRTMGSWNTAAMWGYVQPASGTPFPESLQHMQTERLQMDQVYSMRWPEVRLSVEVWIPGMLRVSQPRKSVSEVWIASMCASFQAPRSARIVDSLMLVRTLPAPGTWSVRVTQLPSLPCVPRAGAFADRAGLQAARVSSASLAMAPAARLWVASTGACHAATRPLGIHREEETEKEGSSGAALFLKSVGFLQPCQPRRRRKSTRCRRSQPVLGVLPNP